MEYLPPSLSLSLFLSLSLSFSLSTHCWHSLFFRGKPRFLYLVILLSKLWCLLSVSVAVIYLSLVPSGQWRTVTAVKYTSTVTYHHMLQSCKDTVGRSMEYWIVYVWDVLVIFVLLTYAHTHTERGGREYIRKSDFDRVDILNAPQMTLILSCSST